MKFLRRATIILSALCSLVLLSVFAFHVRLMLTDTCARLARDLLTATRPQSPHDYLTPGTRQQPSDHLVTREPSATLRVGRTGINDARTDTRTAITNQRSDAIDARKDAKDSRTDIQDSRKDTQHVIGALQSARQDAKETKTGSIDTRSNMKDIRLEVKAQDGQTLKTGDGKTLKTGGQTLKTGDGKTSKTEGQTLKTTGQPLKTGDGKTLKTGGQTLKTTGQPLKTGDGKTSKTGGQTLKTGGQPLKTGDGKTLKTGGQTLKTGGQPLKTVDGKTLKTGGQTLKTGGQTLKTGGQPLKTGDGKTLKTGGQTLKTGGQPLKTGDGQTLKTGDRHTLKTGDKPELKTQDGQERKTQDRQREEKARHGQVAAKNPTGGGGTRGETRKKGEKTLLDRLREEEGGGDGHKEGVVVERGDKKTVGGGNGGRGTPGEGTRQESRPRRRRKLLIYQCDLAASCGGWGDRQRGMVNAYLVAYLTGRRFGVNMTTPCPLTRFYRPPQQPPLSTSGRVGSGVGGGGGGDDVIDWVVTEDDVRNRSVRHVYSMGVTSGDSFHHQLTSVDVERVYPEEVIVLRTNVEHYWSLRTNPHYRRSMSGEEWLRHGRPLFFKAGWDRLMAPTPRLHQLLTDVLTRCGLSGDALTTGQIGEAALLANNTTSSRKPFVCAHVRTGRSKFNKRDSEVRTRIEDLDPLWDFLRTYVNTGSQLFLATDNPEVRTLSREKFGSAHHDSGGVIMHVDKDRGRGGDVGDSNSSSSWSPACNGFESALLDQLVLTRCDVFVVGYSEFSWRAALLRGTVDGLYRLQGGKVTPVTRM